MVKVINKTQLDIEKAEERKIIHRDYLAHCLRWSFALRFIKRDLRVIDIGAGNGMLAQVLYVNRFKPSLYVAVDIRKKALDKIQNRKVNFLINTVMLDVRTESFPYEDNFFDVAMCFECIEHFEDKYLDNVLFETKRILKPGGILLLSTPNYNGKDKAANHIYEYTETELQLHLAKYFSIENKFGTFASKRDILPVMNEHEVSIYTKLSKYYNPCVISILFAPLHPSQSRNILWVCKKV